MSKNVLAGVLAILKFIEFSYLSVYVIQNIDSFNRRAVFIMFSASVFFQSCLSFLQFINQRSIGGLFYYLGERTFGAQTPGIADASINGQLFLRPYATFSHPNVLAGFLVVAMLYLFFIYSKFKFSRLILVAAISAGTIALILTLGRTAIFLWFICLIFLFGKTFDKKYKKGNSNLAGPVLAAVFFILSAVVVFNNSIFLQRFLTTRLTDESIVQRQNLINDSLTMFSKQPFLGTGTDNFYNNLSFVRKRRE